MKPSIEYEEARDKITKIYTEHKDLFTKLHDYGEQVRALSQELHIDLLQKRFCIDIVEEVLIATLDVRESPASLDKEVARIEASQVKITAIYFSRPEGRFYLYGRIPEQPQDTNPEVS
jgi:hypothetical protein